MYNQILMTILHHIGPLVSDLDFLFKANTLIKMCEEKKVLDYERKNIYILFIQFVHFLRY